MHTQLASQPYSPLVTLMTADYLLTAQDLPGWGGNCYTVNFELLLKRTFQLLEKSYFAREVLDRELKIIKTIAEQHNLEQLYNKLLSTGKHRVSKAKDVYGFVLTNSIRFDGKSLNITNLFDACLVVPFIYNIYTNFSICEIPKIIYRQFRILFNQLKLKSTPLVK